MISELLNSSSRFINSIFISGISEENISKLISSPNINNKEELIFPEILFRYPQNGLGITPSILEYIFSEGISIEFNLQPPKFIPIVLTNEKGGRTFVYNIRLFDKILINNKNYYLPYVLSIWSTINNCEGFKNILTEFYRIMKITGDKIIESSIINFHNLEIIHMIIFLTNIIIPPDNSKMILNFHFSSIEFFFPSLTEIPNNEEYIKLLFDCLEISTIIKLWCSLLSEKHIIFLANQGYLLFAVTQGLLSLMFPFCWMHTYIPILPVNQIDILDSPTPYIIGVISKKVDYNTLNDKYPGHVICDLNTSTINQNGVSFLSIMEEDKIKKKIRALYNPKVYEVEDIYLDENDKKKYINKNFELEDVDLKKSFGVNIHYIFFRIFRYQLSVIQNKFIKNKIFDIQNFLDDFCQDDMRDFWDKLTSTVAFDNFLMSLNNVDNEPSSKIFLNILSLEDTENNINEINDKINSGNSNKKQLQKNQETIIITYNLPSNINYILNQFIEIRDINDDYGKALLNLGKDYNSCLEILNIKKSFTKLYNEKVSGNQSFKNKKVNFKKKFPYQLDRVSSPSNLDETKVSRKSLITLSSKEIFNFGIRKEGRKPSLNIIYHQPIKNLFYLYGLDTIKRIEQKIIRNQIRKLSNSSKAINENIIFEMDNNDLLYHQDFLSFSKFFFVTLTLKKHVTLGYKSIFIKKIKILLTKINENIGEEKTEENNEKDNINENSNSNILNLSEDSDTSSSEFVLSNDKNNSSEIKSIDYNSDDEGSKNQSIIINKSENNSHNRDDNKNNNSSENNDIKNNNIICIRNKNFAKLNKVSSTEYLNIINVNSIELSQFFLFSAFVLELDNKNGFNKNILTILNLYEKSFIENDKDFSYYKFYHFLNKIDFVMLQNYYYKRINDSKEYNENLKMYLNIIATLLKHIESKEKGLKRKVRNFRTMKMNKVPNQLKIAIQKCKSINEIKLNNNSEIRHKKTILFENICFNNSLYSYMKSKTSSDIEGNPLKINILNAYKKYKKTSKDPFQIIEEIAVHIYLFILKKSLNKLQPEIINPKLLINLANSVEFRIIKDLVAELQVIDLKYLLNLSDDHKTTFWLNTFNFLMFFAVIYRKENLLTYYEWHKLKKNSYFNIGGINFSLYEIETNILKNNYMAKKLFSEIVDFPKGDSRNKFKINKIIKYINFAIYEPMTSSFKLQLYFPQTFEKQILKNAIDYFNTRIVVDGKNILVKVPEYLSWIDDNFLGNLNYYKPVINNDVYDFINKNQDKVKFIKHDWSLNFAYSIV